MHDTDGRPASTGDLDRFVEDMGLNFEAQGLPRVPSRVISHLVVCDPPEQTADQLVDALRVSRASISAATQLLASSGLVARTTRPGDRRTYYRIDPGVWGLLLLRRAQMAGTTRQIAERGLDALADAPAARRTRLEGLRDFYAFLEKEMPALVEHFEAQMARRDDADREDRRGDRPGDQHGAGRTGARDE